MKLALLSFEYPPETGYGGIGTYTWYQARALVKRGHEVDVLAGTDQTGALISSHHDGVNVYRYRTGGMLMRGLRSLNRMRLWWTKNRLENALSMYRGLKELCAQKQYDLIEMPECGAEGFFINNFGHMRTIVRFHSPAQLIMPFYNARRTDIAFCSRIERVALRKAHAFSACSKFMADEAVSELGITKSVRVIPNGIDVQSFDSEDTIDIHKEFGVPDKKPTILFSGRMEKRKGILLCKEIIGSILEAHDIHVLFAGQDLFGYLSKTLLPYLTGKKLKGSFQYLGKLSQNAVHSCLRQSDIFLLPSLWENCPYSCLEAMTAGCAVVSSDQGGMPELINNEQNGLLAKCGDSKAFIDCLERLIQDADLRRRLGGAARETVNKKFTDMQMAIASEAFYTECLGKGMERALNQKLQNDSKAELVARNL
jgi:glycosyltransferase involved in cell wall biosynthesis